MYEGYAMNDVVMNIICHLKFFDISLAVDRGCLNITFVLEMS